MQKKCIVCVLIYIHRYKQSFRVNVLSTKNEFIVNTLIHCLLQLLFLWNVNYFDVKQYDDASVIHGKTHNGIYVTF